MAVAILAATQVGRGRRTPVAPITDYASARQGRLGRGIVANWTQFIIDQSAAAAVKAINASIKHDSFATQHRVASVRTRVLSRRDVCVVLAACGRAETSNDFHQDHVITHFRELFNIPIGRLRAQVTSTR